MAPKRKFAIALLILAVVRSSRRTEGRTGKPLLMGYWSYILISYKNEYNLPKLKVESGKLKFGLLFSKEKVPKLMNSNKHNRFISLNFNVKEGNFNY